MEETFAEIIRSRRKALKITPKFMILVLDKLHGVSISSSYLTKIELHGEIPSPMMVRKLSILLGIDEEKLLNTAKKEKLQNCITSINRDYK